MAIEDKLNFQISKKYYKLRRKGVTHSDALKQCSCIKNELNEDLSSITNIIDES